jgi:hypothetical protein
MAFKLFVSAAKSISSLQLSRPISRAASTPQDDTSATRAEDLFTKCVSFRARGRRCSYLIVWSEAAAGHATADDHGFDLANNSGIAALGACVSGQRRRLRKTAGELDAPRRKES